MAKLSVDHALQKARSYVKKGKIQEAQKLYQMVLQAFPENKRAQQGLAAVSGPRQTGNLQGPPPEKINQLENLYNQGQLEAVIEQATLLTEQYPEEFIVWHILGAANKGLGRLQAASATLRKVTELNPNYPDGFNNLGVALQDQDKLEEAIEAYNKALSLKPDYAEVHYNMGIALKAQFKLDEAIQAYNKALSLKPDYADAYYNMGIALQEQDKLDEAIASYNKALSLKPDYAEVYYNMGIALKNQSEFDAAIDSYKQALKINPEFATVKHLLASLIGKTTKAAPREYVEDLFDQYAPKFEHSLLEKLEYRTPKITVDMIIKTHPSKKLGSVLDLGCGTGLAGLELRQFCENLDGIDLSKSMLEQAKAKGVYDKLTHGDIIEHLIEADLDFDYFIATDVFVYVGELSDIFKLIKYRNKRRGKLVFSTEHNEKPGFYLEPSGRYSHSKSYIGGLCDKYGYHLSHFETTKLRKEKSAFVNGGLYLLDFDPA